MASRKLLGNLLLSSRSLYRHHLLTSQQVSTACTRLRLVPKDGSCAGYRQFGVFSDFRKKLRDKAHRIHLQSIKEKVEWQVEWLKGTTEELGKFGCVGQKFSDKLKVTSERLEELKGLTEDLVKLSSTSQEFKETLNAALEKVEVVEGAMEDLVISSTSQEFKETLNAALEKLEVVEGAMEDLVISVASDQQTIEMLGNQVDGVQTEAEARTKKVKDRFGIGKEESSACSATSAKEDPSMKNRSNAVFGDSDASKSYPMKLLRKFLFKFK